MNFSLKSIAAAVVLAVAASGASAATINNGANGDGGLFFNAFDGASSYTFNLNTSIDGFETAVAAAGLYNGTWGAAAGFSSSYAAWLSTANASTLEWNILATDTAGARRILSTVGQADLPAKNKTNDVLRTAAGNLQTFVNNVNPTLIGNAGVTTSTAAASYAGTMGSFYPKFSLDTTGTVANNSFANGLVFEKTAALATGVVAGTNTAYLDGTVAVRAWVANDNTLHIGAVAAVPEPESYAMFLAGLGLLGFAARRRSPRA